MTTLPGNTVKTADYPGYVLLTGAGGGIGLGVVDHFLRSGVRKIACQYRSRYAALADLFKSHGLEPEEHCFQAELTDEPQVRELRVRVNQRFGEVWGLVNLAGGSTNQLSWKMPKDEFLQVISQNLLSTFLCIREFTPDLRGRQGGRVINVTSVVAFSGAAGAAHYCAAKAGIVGLTRAVAIELAPKNVSVNALALGYFDQGLIQQVPANLQEELKARTPLRRFGRVNEVAAAIEYLLGEGAGFVTGQVLHINGGLL